MSIDRSSSTSCCRLLASMTHRVPGSPGGVPFPARPSLGYRFRFWYPDPSFPRSSVGCRPRRSASSCGRVGRSPRTRSVPDGIPRRTMGTRTNLQNRKPLPPGPYFSPRCGFAS
jgi:hypothetical protein